jgi:hypothetical protein
LFAWILKFLTYNRLGLIGSGADTPLLFIGLGIRTLFYAIPFLLFVEPRQAFGIGLIFTFVLAVVAEVSGEKRTLSISSSFRQNIARLVAVVTIPLTSLALLANALGHGESKIEFYGVCAGLVWLSLISLESSLGRLAEKSKS